MDVVVLSLLAAGFILFFGSFAEFIFRKWNVPDVLFLILLGFIIGPSALGYVSASDLLVVAPIFTTFTLMFLLFDGAFNINLSSLLSEFSESMMLTMLNFFISSSVAFVVLMGFGFSITSSLFAGFALGGVSSSFVIPILRQLKISGKLFSLLALESALTDVFCIVFSLAVLEFVQLGGASLQATFAQIIALFAVGAGVGLAAGVVWFFLQIKLFEEHNYMLTIAYLLVVYVLTEFLAGSGAIAALFFGLVLSNSKKLSSIFVGITSEKSKDKKTALRGDLGISITTRSEEHFYDQISFFLKTFFFVYIGILIDIADTRSLIIGGILSLAIMASRRVSNLLKTITNETNKGLINSVFARGLAAAAIAQIAISSNLAGAAELSSIIYITIAGTIILSSLSILFEQYKKPIAKLNKSIKSTKSVKAHGSS